MNAPTNSWPEAGSVLIIVDFSAIAFACWATAQRAQEAGEESLKQHALLCEASKLAGPENHPADCEGTKLIKQYDAHEVLKTNLRLKMATLEEHTGEPASRYVMALDCHAKWRFDLFPGYKGDRDPNKYNPRPEAEAFLREAYPDMQWVRSPGNEADDCIATLVCANKAQRAIVIVSGDKDLWTLLEPRVKIFAPVTKRFLDLETVSTKFYGLEPRHIRLAKSLWGDPSDSIPNCVPRQQRQLVPLIKDTNGDLNQLTNLKGRVSNKCWELLQRNAGQIAQNWKVVGLNDNVDLEWV